MALALKLSHDEPRLVYLALVYHLGRPGSELDPATATPLEHGLREVKTALGNALSEESATIELDGRGYDRLLSAMYGTVNELRVHHMRTGAESTVPRFTETLVSLWPETREDPGVALEVAEAMMMLHRRIERAVGQALAAAPKGEPAKKRRWPFGKG
jgi:hypothetical protein